MSDITHIHDGQVDDAFLQELGQWNELLEKYAGRKLQPRDTVSTTFLLILNGMNSHICNLERDYATILERLNNLNQ